MIVRPTIGPEHPFEPDSEWYEVQIGEFIWKGLVWGNKEEMAIKLAKEAND